MIEGLPVVSLTAPTLLLVAVLLIFTGRLIPRPQYREMLAEKERWRHAYEAEREARSTSDSQTAQLLEFAKTNHSVVTAMFESIRDLRESGGSNVLQKET